jgi:hypothetical protein
MESIDPSSNVTGPSCDFWSLNKCKGECDLLDGRVVSCDVLVEAKVSFDFLDEVIGSGSISVKDLR